MTERGACHSDKVRGANIADHNGKPDGPERQCLAGNKEILGIADVARTEKAQHLGTDHGNGDNNNVYVT